MRYKIDSSLVVGFRQELSMLLDEMPHPTGDVGDEIKELCLKYFELGFDSGCRSCTVYSDELRRLYSDVDIPKPWIDM